MSKPPPPAASRWIEARAKEDRQGLWKGCFVAPREFRAGKQDGALLGAACRTDRDREIREALFPKTW